MMDLLSSILNSMEKPPSLSNDERNRIKKSKDEMIKREQIMKEKLRVFKKEVEERINNYSNKENEKRLIFKPMDKLFRTVIHEVASDAGMLTYSFGRDGIDRYCVVYKKEHIPNDDELNALRRGEEWNDDICKQIVEKRKLNKLESERPVEEFNPTTDYKEKYQHIIGLESAKEAARKTGVNEKYGFVPSENKKDSRSIEQTLADIQSKKKFKHSNGI